MAWGGGRCPVSCKIGQKNYITVGSNEGPSAQAHSPKPILALHPPNPILLFFMIFTMMII